MTDDRKWAANQFARYDGVVDGVMQWTFRPELNQPVLRFEHTKINEAVRAGAVEIALKNKIGDVGAMGQTATAVEKIAAMRAEAERLAAADATWNRAERPRKPAVDQFLEDLIVAVSRYQFRLPTGEMASKSLESARKWLSAMNEAQRQAVSRMDKYAPILEQVVAERIKAAGIDIAKLEAEADAI